MLSPLRKDQMETDWYGVLNVDDIYLSPAKLNLENKRREPRGKALLN